MKHLKNATRNLGTFDDLSRSQAENTLFNVSGNASHFDSVLYKLVKGTDYESAFKNDLNTKDDQGNTVETRLNMYTPLYYLCDYYDGYKTSTVAKYWRIRTGIEQTDTSLCTEVNLALALENYGVYVDFTTVLGQGHTEAEERGSSTENFINWVNTCLK